MTFGGKGLNVSAVLCRLDTPNTALGFYGGFVGKEIIRMAEEEGYSDTDALVWEAMEAYGVQDYVALSRGGITYAIFGIFGEEADADAPMSGMVLSDPIEIAQATVDKIRAEVETEEPLFIICLSHCGTATGGGSEDDSDEAGDEDANVDPDLKKARSGGVCVKRQKSRGRRALHCYPRHTDGVYAVY